MEKKTLNLVQKQGTYKLIIPTEVEQKIRYACKEVWDTEWSGTLFFTYEGNFNDGSLVITCKDIFVMDIGTRAYTEFDMNPDVIGYMCEHPELLDCQMGLIHSHNNMSTFFSGTDTSTLKEEGRDRNNFVSLIVNNAGSYTAAITRTVTSTKTIKDCYNYEFFGEGNIEDCKEYTTEETNIEWYYLDIIKEGNEFDCSEMKSRFEEIRKVKKEQEAKKPKNTAFPSTNHNSSYTPYIPPKEYTPTTSKSAMPVQKELPFELNDRPEIPYGEVTFDKNNLEALFKQLITGSITLTSSSKIDVIEFSKVMTKVYERRFGEGESGMKLFDIWAQNHIEFIVYFSEDDKLSELGYDDDEIASICAHDLIVKLTELPENRYIKEFIDLLETYLLL